MFCWHFLLFWNQKHPFIVMHENKGNELLADFIESWISSKWGQFLNFVIVISMDPFMLICMLAASFPPFLLFLTWNRFFLYGRGGDLISELSKSLAVMVWKWFGMVIVYFSVCSKDPVKICWALRTLNQCLFTDWIVADMYRGMSMSCWSKSFLSVL